MSTLLTVPVKINNRSITISYTGLKQWSSMESAYDSSTFESLTSLFSLSGSVVTYNSKTLKYNNVDVVPSDTIVDYGEYTTQQPETTKDITTITGYSGLSAGQHVLGVKATDSTGTYDDSSMPTVTFTKLAAPSNESISGNNYTFGEVANAEEYDIYAGNTFLGTVAPVRNVTVSFNLTFTRLAHVGQLYFNFDEPFTNESNCDWEVAGGWAFTGFNQYYYNRTGNAPTMPNTQYYGSSTSFTIEVPVGTEIYVHGGETYATDQSINYVSIPVPYAQAVKYTITENFAFNIKLSGEDD